MSASGACYATVYVDGALYYTKATDAPGVRTSGPPDMRRLDANDYAGIEFYPGGATIPPQYNGTDSGCGVLLLWTRER
jgi:hypothetical protein